MSLLNKDIITPDEASAIVLGALSDNYGSFAVRFHPAGPVHRLVCRMDSESG